jgi:hypothetical protein
VEAVDVLEDQCDEQYCEDEGEAHGKSLGETSDVRRKTKKGTLGKSLSRLTSNVSRLTSYEFFNTIA